MISYYANVDPEAVWEAGGVWGYAELCEILADPNHPDYSERVDWLGHPHDPAAFDKDAINTSLARMRLG